MGKLTQIRIRTLSKPGRYGDGDGLWLQVRDATRRAWLFRYRMHGRARAMGLGPLLDVGLGEAREAARECRRLVRRGLDPIEHRRTERAAGRLAAGHVFRDVIEQYIKAHQGAWRNDKHRAQWRSSLTAYALPYFGDRPIAAIETGDVTAALEPIWSTLPETASRLRGRIEAVLDFAKARGWRNGENPARWRGHLKNLLPSRAKLARVKHHPALPYSEMSEFMAELRQQAGMGALALQFTVLTAARTGEVIGARWSEIDQQRHLWIVPAERMKAAREHRVPLSDAALAVLKVAKTGSKPDAFIFPGPTAGKGLSNMAMNAVLRRMDRTDITVHGMRSAFRDWAAEATGYPREVAEAALAHTLSDKVEAAYRRRDLLAKRARLMADWATYCKRRNVSGSVVPMRTRRSV